MKIRQGRPADVEAIVAMCATSMRAVYGAFFSEEQMRPWIGGDETRNYITGMLDSTLVAAASGEILGVATIKDDLIDLLWVAEDRRGEGIGRALVEQAQGRIRTGGHAQARLECFEANTNAIACYAHLGYRQIDRYQCPIAAVPKVVMAKPL